MKKDNYYRCYSTKIKEKLMEFNEEYIIIAKDIKTNKTFWLFEKNEIVNNILEQFNK